MGDARVGISDQRPGRAETEQALAAAGFEPAVQRRGNILDHLTAHRSVERQPLRLRQQRPEASCIGRAERLFDIPFAFQQRSRAAVFAVDIQPRIAGDVEIVEGCAGRVAAAIGWNGVCQLRDPRAEPRENHDVHDLLVGRISVTQRHFFREDFHPLDRFGWDFGDLGQARHALTV